MLPSPAAFAPGAAGFRFFGHVKKVDHALQYGPLVKMLSKKKEQTETSHSSIGLLHQFPGIMTNARRVGLSRHLAVETNVDFDTN